MIKTDSIFFAYAVEILSLYFLCGFLSWLAYELIMSGKDGYGWMMIAGAIVAFFSASTTCIKREKNA